jgi:ATP-dependent Clp protease ATP-binding subunit ClpC
MITRDNWTDRLRAVLALAQKRAKKCGHQRLSTGHLLIALAESTGTVAEAVLGSLCNETNMFSLSVDIFMQAACEDVPDGDLPLTENAEKAIRRAPLVSGNFGNTVVGPEHLLLGLLNVDNCTANKALGRMTITPEMIKQAISHHFEAIDFPLTSEAEATLLMLKGRMVCSTASHAIAAISRYSPQ